MALTNFISLMTIHDETVPSDNRTYLSAFYNGILHMFQLFIRHRNMKPYEVRIDIEFKYYTVIICSASHEESIASGSFDIGSASLKSNWTKCLRSLYLPTIRYV